MSDCDISDFGTHYFFSQQVLVLKQEMKFGKSLRENTLKEWRFYSVDYKTLKKTLKKTRNGEGDCNCASLVHHEFFRVLEDSESKLSKFYHDKENWALGYVKTLKEHVDGLREAAQCEESPIELESSSSSSSASSLSSEDEGTSSSALVLNESFVELTDKVQNSANKHAGLKEEYRRMGKSKHFNAFIYAKKSLVTFDRELSLLLEFLNLNKTAFHKILKKFDKQTGSSIREEKMEELLQSNRFLEGHVLLELKEDIRHLIDEVNNLKPRLPNGWEDRKVYTIGCFDLFHRGHQNVLLSLREFGYYIVAGIHDDSSYYQLKKKNTIDNLETRIKNVKPFVDQLFVIPSTDPPLRSANGERSRYRHRILLLRSWG